ncbi:MAG: flagellar brake protein [Gallionellaceae bacterium]|nr:MAG: flagellar brake protein [Gallionellaceae bacterium]
MTHPVENSQFAVHNRKEIIFILEDMAKHRTALNLDTREGVSLVTAVLELSADGSYIYLDISPDDRINDKITDSKHVTFSTQSGVKVRWHATQLTLVELSDGNAFEMPLPAAIERIQRREYFRLGTPQGSKALICKIPVFDADVEKETIGATIVDMSVGGIGISVKGTPHAIFSQGAILQGCSVVFPVIGVVPLTLKVCGIWTSVKTKSGEQMYHIGLEFVSLSRGAGNVVQRYMIQLESERISLL